MDRSISAFNLGAEKLEDKNMQEIRSRYTLSKGIFGEIKWLEDPAQFAGNILFVLGSNEATTSFIRALDLF